MATQNIHKDSWLDVNNKTNTDWPECAQESVVMVFICERKLNIRRSLTTSINKHLFDHILMSTLYDWVWMGWNGPDSDDTLLNHRMKY